MSGCASFPRPFTSTSTFAFPVIFYFLAFLLFQTAGQKEIRRHRCQRKKGWKHPMRRDSVSVLIYKNSPRTPYQPFLGLASHPRVFVDRARSTPTQRPILRVNNRQIPYRPIVPNQVCCVFPFSFPRRSSLFLYLSLSPVFFFSPFSFVSIASRSRADRSSHGRRTSFISSLVNETIYQRLCQNKNCYKTLASHERFCIADFVRVYTY